MITNFLSLIIYTDFYIHILEYLRILNMVFYFFDRLLNPANLTFNSDSRKNKLV